MVVKDVDGRGQKKAQLQERRDNIYTEISIIEVAKLCGINMKDTGRVEIRCQCPFCNAGKSKMAASLNRDKNLFHCFRCGEGLNSITLYSKVFGTSDLSEAYKELLDIVA